MVVGIGALTTLGAITAVRATPNEATQSKSTTENPSARVVKKSGSATSFTGVSKRGDLAEALGEAIKQAKTSLRTDYVTWTMEKISGKDGGFAQTNEISVTIKASGP